MKNFFQLTLMLLVGVLASFAWGSGAVYAQDENGDVDRISMVLPSNPTLIVEITLPFELVLPYVHLDWHGTLPEAWRPCRYVMATEFISPIHTSKSKGFNPALDWPALQDC